MVRFVASRGHMVVWFLATMDDPNPRARDEDKDRDKDKLGGETALGRSGGP